MVILSAVVVLLMRLRIGSSVLIARRMNNDYVTDTMKLITTVKGQTK
jgi:hypothetical protein